MVEQRTENPRVTGSIPVGTTTNRETQNLASLFLCIVPCGILETQSIDSVESLNCVSTAGNEKSTSFSGSAFFSIIQDNNVLRINPCIIDVPLTTCKGIDICKVTRLDKIGQVFSEVIRGCSTTRIMDGNSESLVQGTRTQRDEEIPILIQRKCNVVAIKGNGIPQLARGTIS